MKLLQKHRQALKTFKDIIQDVEFLPCKSDQQIRLKITFVDETNLRISEIYLKDRQTDYSYYYLNQNNDLIIGWDTAPHHSHLKTHPYHKHVGEAKKLETSQKMDLFKVLKYIQQEQN